MEQIKPKDFLVRKKEMYEELPRGEKMWVDDEKLLLKATIIVLTEKINELIKRDMHKASMDRGSRCS